jgi:putative oxidoreductase
MKAVLVRLFAVGQNSQSVDLALLLLRIMVTTSLIYHHGIAKILDWNLLTTHPLDPIGIGVVPSLIYAGFCDLLCAFLVLVGFATRISSFFCITTLATVAFLMDHALTTPYFPIPHTGHGEISWVYMAAFVVTIIAGPGRYSVDAKLRLS